MDEGLSTANLLENVVVGVVARQLHCGALRDAGQAGLQFSLREHGVEVIAWQGCVTVTERAHPFFRM